MRCELCIYWVERRPPRATDGRRQGYCHYSPPSSGSAIPFAAVNHDEFCSKFKKRKEQ
jgi:hypothetical protein